MLQAHHLRHAVGHAGGVISHLAKLNVAVRRRLPGVARELDDLDDAIPGSRGAMGEVPDAALDMSCAHDLSEAQAAAAHVDRHLAEAQAATGSPVSVLFNIQHGQRHIDEIAHNLSELDADLTRRLPAVARELALLPVETQPAVTAPSEVEKKAYAETAALFAAGSRWGGAI